MGPWLLSISVALVAYTLYSFITSRTTRKKLPPGPKPWPILGNISDFPPSGTPEHEHWAKHAPLYGPISSVTLAGSTLILVHDRRLAHDLLDRNARRTSGRPQMVMANKLSGFGSIVVCQTYDNSTFKRYRRLMQQELGTKTTTARFADVQVTEIARQLVRVLRDPGKLDHHYDSTSTAMILRMTYGYAVEPDKPDVLVSLIKQTIFDFSQAANPMSWAVDLVPALQYLPEWFPGAAFKTTARRFRNNLLASAHVPYNFARNQMVLSSSSSSSSSDARQPSAHWASYVSKLVDTLSSSSSSSHDSCNNNATAEKPQGITNSRQQHLDPEDEKAIIWTAASLYGAGSDTTAMTMRIFTLALLKFPHVQTRAQAEIDALIGSPSPRRLPGFEDREKLPYIEALLKETLRWWAIAPMGFPHTVTEGFEYTIPVSVAAGKGEKKEGEEGAGKTYYLPKGAVILPAMWAMMRDPTVYSRPDDFDPSRFLAPHFEPDPRAEAFGFGRRVCPGRYFAEASLFLEMVQMLAVFKISRVLDADGEHEVGVETLDGVRMGSGVLAHPSVFECRVEPRSERHAELVRELEVKFPREKSDADKLPPMEEFGIGCVV